jgi:hypothetical protein
MPKGIWPKLDEESLVKEYLEDGLSLTQLAKKYQSSAERIRKILQRRDIAIRMQRPARKVGDLINGCLEIVELYRNIRGDIKHQYKLLCPECNREFMGWEHMILRKNTINCGCVKYKKYGDITETLWHHFKSGAKQRNIKFEITKEYAWKLFVKQRKRCALSSLPLSFGIDTRRRNQHTRTASLDRIDSDGDYIEGNVRWLHKDINMMKRHYSDERFMKLCSAIYKFQELNELTDEYLIPTYQRSNVDSVPEGTC